VSLFPPASVSIAADGLAILTLATASIPLIQNLAYVSSFWVATMAVSVVTLHPVLLSYLPPPRPDPRFGKRFSDRVYRTINRGFVRLARGGVRYAVAGTMFAALAIGLTFAQLLRVGDLSVGKALLFDSHPYNRAFDFLNSKFVGSAQLIVIAEGDRPGAIQDRKVLEKLEAFQRYMEQSEDTGGSITITNLLKRIFRVYHEGEPRWESLPDSPKDLAQLFFTLESSTRPGEMDRFFSSGYQNATVTVFYRSYSNEVITRSIARAKEFIAANPLEHVHFRLAGGLMGILAAVNEEVEWSYRFNIGLVMVTVFMLSFLTYRSVIASFIVMIPSIVAQPLSEAVMYLAGIDLNIQSLPVAAIGIGIGIDYGYYLLSRIIEELTKTHDFDAANERALMSTGRAILFTGTTLTVSVIFWLWFPMKFQAEMAFLLATLLAFHVIGALVFIPTMVSLLKPRFASLLAERPGSDRERETRQVGGVGRKGG
jgi:predicted RND superfamily exporter protein